VNDSISKITIDDLRPEDAADADDVGRRNLLTDDNEDANLTILFGPRICFLGE